MPKVTQHNTQTALAKSGFLDFLDEGQFTEWLSQYGKNILYVLAGIISLLVIIYAFSSGMNNKAEQEYIQATNDFSYFSKSYDAQNPALSQEALKRLNGLISKHPELHATYDGAIAQILLNRELASEATPYATATLARVKSNNLPFYSDYAETTLLISHKNFEVALKNAQALQQKMIEALAVQSPETRTFGDELFALNLLRVAILQQEIGDHAAELQTWQEWKQYAGLAGSGTKVANVNPQAFRSVIQQLAVGSISLPDYISYRENLLKK